MRPLTVLIGIVMGSSVSLAVGLVLTWVVFLFLPEYSDRLAPERASLAQAIGIFTLLAAVAVLSFYGDLRRRPWRTAAHLALVGALALAVWTYWPR